MFDIGFPGDWSSLKKLIWLKAAISGGGASAIWKTVSGTLIHITDALASPMQKCEVTLEPIQAGSGDPSPTNVRPITGWTGAKVTRVGNNLLPSEAQDVSNWSAGTTQTGGYKFWKCNLPSGTYYVHSPHEVPYNNTLYMRAVVYDATGGYTRVYMYHPTATDENRDVLGVTIPQGWYLQLERYGNEGDAFTDNLWITISENTPYSAYSGTTLSVTFPDGQTVYGGTVDLVSGELVVDRASLVFDGTQPGMGANWQTKENSTAWWYQYQLTNHKFPSVLDTVPTFLASSCPVVTPREIINGTNPTLLEVSCYNSTSIGIIFRSTDMTLTTAAAVNAYLAANPVQLVYELAEPIEIQLTPQQISTLAGENNVWSNGDSVEITYKA